MQAIVNIITKKDIYKLQIPWSGETNITLEEECQQISMYKIGKILCYLILNLYNTL